MHLYWIDEPPTDQHTPSSPFQGYLKLQ
jgi:hypothetical protein